MLENAGLTEGVKALVNCVGVSVKSIAKWAFQKHMEIAFFDIFYKFLLLFNGVELYVNFLRIILWFLATLLHLLIFLALVISLVIRCLLFRGSCIWRLELA